MLYDFFSHTIHAILVKIVSKFLKSYSERNKELLCEDIQIIILKETASRSL